MIETIGNLKIGEELGHGGMGVVYLAEHISLGKKFAVKSLNAKFTDDPNFEKRFFQEAQNQATLTHPNIVQVVDYQEEQGQYFIVMEFVDGEDLDNFIRRKGRLSEKEALAILKGILKGLGFAHRQGMIHRDIKPSNIMISMVGNDLHVSIMDFGLAILVGGERLTMAESGIIGSPWYQSPEQIKDPKGIDHRSDIYSLGIVLFEMLTGRVPFDGEIHSVIHQQVYDRTPDITKVCPEISKDLAGIVNKCTEKDPAKRFQGCDDLLNQLKQIEIPISPPPRPPWKWIIGAAVVLCCLIVVASFDSKKYSPFVKQEDKTEQTDSTKRSEKYNYDHVKAEVKACVIQIDNLYILIKRLSKIRDLMAEERKQRNPSSEFIANLGNSEKEKMLKINIEIKEFNETTEKLAEYPNEVVTEKLKEYLQKEVTEEKKNLAQTLLQFVARGRTELDVAEFEAIFCSN